MKVLITHKIPDIITNLLGDMRVEMNNSDELLPAVRFKQMAGDSDAIICSIHDIIDRPIMEASPKLKVIAVFGENTDNIDINYAEHRGIAVCSTKHILTQSNAELGFALLMSAARNIHISDRNLRNNNFTNTSSVGVDLYKKTIGFYGFGNTGQAAAKIASGFSMEIIYHSRERYKQGELILGATYASFDELLEWSDFIMITEPVGYSTEPVFNINQFKMMKKNAVIINISSNKLINLNDLVSALDDDYIFSSGIAINDTDTNKCSILKKSEKIVLYNNTSSYTYETLEKMTQSCSESIISVLHGGILPESAVNRPVHHI